LKENGSFQATFARPDHRFRMVDIKETGDRKVAGFKFESGGQIG
jgi:hypothetical protein